MIERSAEEYTNQTAANLHIAEDEDEDKGRITRTELVGSKNHQLRGLCNIGVMS